MRKTKLFNRFAGDGFDFEQSDYADEVLGTSDT